MSPASPLLSTHALVASYGDFQALFGVDIEVAAGEIVALIGANGAGKSTLLKCLVGLMPSGPGMVRLDGDPISGLAPHRIVQRGIAMVPEGRRLFSGMSVEDNLRVAIDHARRLPAGASGWTLPRVYELFPAIGERRRLVVDSLSGGQQQMVAIGRALLCNPRLLLCDELSLGLAHGVIREVYAALRAIAAEGTALVLVEQDVSLAQRSSARLYCLLEGRITLSGRSNAFGRAALTAAFFGAHHALA